jgi:DNA-binding CsgD family transcriptional regulator
MKDKSTDEADKLAPLTKREREISLLSINGLACDKISQNLGISYWTVRTHRRNALRKLDAHGFSELSGLFNASKEKDLMKSGSLIHIKELTKRENEIANLICCGLSCKQIAKKIDLSHFTVRKFRERVYRKLKINTAAELRMRIYSTSDVAIAD